MPGSLLRRLLKAERAAVAPTIGLSLFALIGVGGIAFDYARLAAMDSELQNAADQAALAAASQLDGESGTCNRAVNAALSLVQNHTRFANDGEGFAVEIEDNSPCNEDGSISFGANDTIKFYADEAKTTVSTNDADAHFVEVTVNTREAFYALTPVVAAFSSGDIAATAYAGLGEAVCKVPPVMMCNPDEEGDSDFTTSDYIGKGILLVARANQADPYGPGNFGFLENGYDSNGGGANELRKVLGQLSSPTDCSPETGVTTEPGAMSPVLDAINTRFDIYSSNTLQNATCGAGQCPPSTNVRKDLVRDDQGNGSSSSSSSSNGQGSNGGGQGSNGGGQDSSGGGQSSNGGGSSGPACTLASENGNSAGWKQPDTGRYLPTSATADLDASVPLSPMGHPRDKCHAFNSETGCTGGRIGTGNWDRAAYFRSNFGSSYDWQAAMNAAYGTTAVTRYQVYKWELINANRALSPGGINNSRAVAPGTSYSAPTCQTPGYEPVGDLDRRRLSIAVINCEAENISGRTTGVEVARWVDVFLVEPSAARARTTANDLYVEVIGETSTSGTSTQATQVKKGVPYLIE